MPRPDQGIFAPPTKSFGAQGSVGVAVRTGQHRWMHVLRLVPTLGYSRNVG